MVLSKLLEGLTYEFRGRADLCAEISNIVFDSREAGKGAVFCCLIGTETDGHKYIDQVVEKGAAAVVYSEDSAVLQESGNTQFIKVGDTRKALAVMSANFWKNPSRELGVIGVTGTNGKTSITHYIHQILNDNGSVTGLIGTTGMLAGHHPMNYKIKASTTPDPMELHEIMRIMKDQYQVKEVSMEVTSHALALQKLEAVEFETAVFSNLTQDHLDFHGSMEGYLNAKLKLMKKCKTAVINMDSEVADRFIECCDGRVITYGIDKACDFQARNVQCNFSSVEYDMEYNGNRHHIFVPVPGRFTVYNSLATLITCLEKNIDIERVKQSLSSIEGVPGRMQTVPNGLGINIIVDYAHTPDSLQNILNAVNGFTEGRVFAVTGCGGNRDRDKRPKMGMIAYNNADYTVLTSDNPRNEYPDHILIEMLRDISAAMLAEPSLADRDKKRVTLLPDRREAIRFAITSAKKGDTIVIAGKGHEAYQELRDKVRLHFDDSFEADNIVKMIQNERLPERDR